MDQKGFVLFTKYKMWLITCTCFPSYAAFNTWQIGNVATKNTKFWLGSLEMMFNSCLDIVTPIPERRLKKNLSKYLQRVSGKQKKTQCRFKINRKIRVLVHHYKLRSAKNLLLLVQSTLCVSVRHSVRESVIKKAVRDHIFSEKTFQVLVKYGLFVFLITLICGYGQYKKIWWEKIKWTVKILLGSLFIYKFLLIHIYMYTFFSKAKSIHS